MTEAFGIVLLLAGLCVMVFRVLELLGATGAVGLVLMTLGYVMAHGFPL